MAVTIDLTIGEKFLAVTIDLTSVGPNYSNYTTIRIVRTE